MVVEQSFMFKMHPPLRFVLRHSASNAHSLEIFAKNWSHSPPVRVSVPAISALNQTATVPIRMSSTIHWSDDRRRKHADTFDCTSHGVPIWRPAYFRSTGIEDSGNQRRATNSHGIPWNLTVSLSPVWECDLQVAATTKSMQKIVTTSKWNRNNVVFQREHGLGVKLYGFAEECDARCVFVVWYVCFACGRRMYWGQYSCLKNMLT